MSLNMTYMHTFMIQYCKKVMQTIIVEYRALFLRYIMEIYRRQIGDIIGIQLIDV